ncbi:MAG TPA: trehalose-phosphatase [Terriglobales bacterium]|nr:trehalose-phosphatase [Terriglobales bacterium]
MSTVPAHPNRAHAVLGVYASRRDRALLLDYDGTIAPFVNDRSRAHPYPQVPALLDEIMERCGTRVVIVSGRPVKDITLLLQTRLRPEIWGCYGLERLLPAGQYSCVRLSPECDSILSETALRLEGAGLAAYLEQKRGCVAVHWRGLLPNRQEEIRALAYRTFSMFTGRNGFFVSEFDGGVELRHRAGTKRHAVETILSELGSDVAVAYMGDDATDEEAFRLLNDRGLTILVRPTYRFTAAQLWLQPPQELRAFLSEWIAAGSEEQR